MCVFIVIKVISKLRGDSQLVSRLCELLGHREWCVSAALCVLLLLFFSLSMAADVTESTCSINLLLSLRITQLITTLRDQEENWSVYCFPYWHLILTFTQCCISA